MQSDREPFYPVRYLLKRWRELLFPSVPPLIEQSSQTLDRDDVTVVKKWLRKRTAWYDTGIVHTYESKFAQWNGSSYAFAFMGGRVAFSACLDAIGINEGDEVIVPAYTCVVVPNAVHFAGADVVYCDIELDTFGPDLRSFASKVTSRTKAVVIQHLYGLVCRDYEGILDFARKRGIRVIEDCAHATGAIFKGVKVGNRGDVAFYSSNRSKVFSTVEGGIAIANDELVAEKLRAFRDKARFPSEELIDKFLHNVFLDYYSLKHPKKAVLKDWIYAKYPYKHLYSTSAEELAGECPPNYLSRMPAPIAALGLNQLRKIERYNELRRMSAGYWETWCKEHGYKTPLVIEGSVPVFLRYPVLVEAEKKSDSAWAERELNVELGVWFISNLHPVGIMIADCPNAEKAVKQCVNFPGIYIENRNNRRAA